MTRKEENKILDAKIESNVNQHKVDRMNAEISPFSSGDLNKYEFLNRINLNYKPNALDKARFEFSSLGKTFSAGLDKTAQGYQEEGVMELLKDIRDSLRGGARPSRPDDNNDDNNNDDDDDRPDYNNMPDLETEEEAAKRISTNALDKFKNNIEIEMNNLDKIVKNKENEFNTKLNKSNNDVKKIDYFIKENNDKIIKKEKEYNEIFLKYNESIKELEKTKDELNKENDNNQFKKIQKKLNDQNDIVKELESELDDKEENIKTLKDNNKDLENIIKIKDIEIEKLEKIKINHYKEIKEFEEELEKSYKNINERKADYNKLKILNDEVNEEIQELKKELQEYSNEIDKLYSSDNTSSQKTMKMIEEINKEKKELKEKINVLKEEKKELETKMNNADNELSHAVNLLKKTPEKLKIYEKVKNTEFKLGSEEESEEEPEEYHNIFDENGINKYTHTKYDFSGFDKYGKHKDTKDKYDTNGFNIKGLHMYTKDKYDTNGFNIKGLHKDTKDKYGTNGFNIKGLHKDINTFLNKEKNIRKDLLKNINSLKDGDEFLKLYNEIIKNGEFIVDTKKNEHISSGLLKKFLEKILSGDIKYNEVEDYIESISDIEEDLNKFKKSEKIDKLKQYIKKIKYSVYGEDKEKIKTDQAKSFEDQKGKGYVYLPIALSKIYTNNSSKELIKNIKQLIIDLCGSEQITKQVYHNIIKAITYKK